MTIFIFQTHISITLWAFFSSASTIFWVFFEISILYHLFAISAWLWFHKALSIMISKLSFFKLYFAILANYFSVGFFIMFFFFNFDNDIATDLAFIVISCTPNLMHSEFWHFNFSFTITAFFSLYNLFLLYLVFCHWNLKGIMNFKLNSIIK